MRKENHFCNNDFGNCKYEKRKSLGNWIWLMQLASGIWLFGFGSSEFSVISVSFNLQLHACWLLLHFQLLVG